MRSRQKPLKTLDAFCKAAQFSSEGSRIWLERLAMVSTTNTLDLFKRIPTSRISSTAVEFAQSILEINQNYYYSLTEQIFNTLVPPCEINN